MQATHRPHRGVFLVVLLIAPTSLFWLAIVFSGLGVGIDYFVSAPTAQTALTRAGYTVVTASQGEEGLERYAQMDKVDLILTDVMMPELDGISALPQLLAKKRNLIIIMASTLTRRDSSNGRFHAFQVLITATGPLQLEAINSDLRATGRVHMVL